MMNEDKKTQETREQEDRFAYMHQKPHYSRKAIVALGISLAMVLIFVIGSAYFVVGSTIESVSQFAADYFSKTEDPFIEEASIREEVEYNDYYDRPTNGPDGHIVREEPEDDPPQTERKESEINFTLHEISLENDVIVEPTFDGDYGDKGYYILEPGKVYAIWWSAAPLFNGEKISADLDISSDFLIEEGTTGTISVSVYDTSKGSDTDYAGELIIGSDSGNLGIEFCAEKCGLIRAYGWYPSLRDDEFVVCFYTSGEYDDGYRDGVYGPYGHYGFECKVDGGEYENSLVARLAEESRITPPSVINDCPDPADRPATKPTPDPGPSPETYEPGPNGPDHTQPGPSGSGAH